MFVFYLSKYEVLQRYLSIKPLLSLGKISFEIYAFHWPIMLTVEAGLFLMFIEKTTYNVSAVGAFILTIPFIYGVSYVMNKSIGFLKQRLSRI